MLKKENGDPESGRPAHKYAVVTGRRLLPVLTVCGSPQEFVKTFKYR
jgi:hypothetical protein